MNKYTPDGFEKGLAYLHQAAEMDPEEPFAQAGLAIGYNLLVHSSSPPPGAMQKAKAATYKALKLDDNLAEVHLGLGEIRVYSDWDRKGAEKSFIRALELNPNLALCYAHYAFLIMIEGRFEEGFAKLYRAQKLDPLFPTYPAWTGWAYYWLGQNDKAIAEAKKSLELVPDFPIALYVLGSAYAAKGMFEEAIEVHGKVTEVSQDWKWGLGVTHALAGNREMALQIAEEMSKDEKAWVTWGIAEIYSALNETDDAFYWLEKAYEMRHPYIQWFNSIVTFENIKDDPRYQDLAKRLNLTD